MSSYVSSVLNGPGWLFSPVEITIKLDPFYSLGEVPDVGQEGAKSVAEAYVVPDWCYSGRAWAYNRIGGRIVGEVTVRAMQAGQRVWHQGLQVSVCQ